MKAIYKIMALFLLFLGLAACKEKEETPQSLANIKITTTEVTDITATSAVSGGEITDNGGYSITKRGVCWGAAENPTLTGDKTTDGSGDGAFTSTITGIEPAKTYHVRAYALCAAGVAYGNDVTFSVPVFEPSVKTGLVTDLGMDFAVVAGEVTSAMGGTVTEVGVYYGTATNPTTKAAAAQVADKFSVSLSNLTENTTYYVKAYAVNEAGTGYGEEITFTTSADPVVTFADANLQDYMSFTYGNDAGEVRKSVADTITILDIANQGIASLEGIKNLKNLKKLVANNNSFVAVDLSEMTSLEFVDIGWNKVGLQSVNIDGCSALKVFNATDPADGASPETFAPDAPALEDLTLNLWRTLKTLDLSKCVNLKNFWACQMYVVGSIDLTYSNKLEYVWIPDIFAATSFKISSPVLWYLGMWNAKALTSVDLTACPSLVEFIANDGGPITELKLNCANTLQKINVNCWRDLEALDLTNYVNLKEINAIQLFKCANLKMPSDCSHLTYLWLADALLMEEVSLTNIPNNARIMMWGNPVLKTMTYTTNQEIIGWNWNDNLEMSDEGAFPGNNIEVFNITAPKAKKIWFNNANKLKSLDLSSAVILEEFRGHQMNNVTSVSFASPELKFVYMPDAYALTSLDLTCTQKLAQLQMWACNNVKTLKVNSPALWEINICNLGELTTFDATIPNIQFLFVNGCQKLPNVDVTNHTALKTFEANWTKAMTAMDFTGCSALEKVYCPDSNVQTMTFSGNPNCKIIQCWACHNLGPNLDLRGCADAMTELNAGTEGSACAALQKVILREGQTIGTIFKGDGVTVVNE